MSEFSEVKTADLVGAALDWGVAKAEGLDCGLWKKGSAPGYCVIIVSTFFCPATKWADCGPLIEKYQIDLTFERKGTIYAYPCNDDGLPDTSRQFDEYGSFGSTYLIAACRAIVASVLGETVSVPKELLS
ncbi:DUF2591 domain-containing protein [Pseudomonas syringae]|uniref:phage protein NinX family protein n=1 Tax=Pseudomonas syringae TaxID=317 RepID=UPI001F2EF165|nr:phage protein NinX family protein [Pseudomonas syringae]MCF5551909.1 DUF2591 domain-containing protein [Pseudomonas syringae]